MVRSHRAQPTSADPGGQQVQEWLRTVAARASRSDARANRRTRPASGGSRDAFGGLSRTRQLCLAASHVTRSATRRDSPAFSLLPAASGGSVRASRRDLRARRGLPRASRHPSGASGAHAGTRCARIEPSRRRASSTARGPAAFRWCAASLRSTRRRPGSPP
jgi:hypothetical protein